MVDPLPDKVTSPSSAINADPDVKVNQLLLAGLDHYVKADYARAIDLWSRVLFLDRQHARARAYIERARAAAAERIRESEELLHTGTEAFKRGNADEARALLSSAAARGRDEALPMLDRLARLETAAGRSEPSPPKTKGGRVAPREVAAPAASDRPALDARRVRLVPLVALCLALLAGVYLTLSFDRLETLWFADSVPVAGPRPDWRGPLPVPSSAELRLERARRLVAAGETRPALDLLAGIESGDPRRADADALSAEIQAGLLGADGSGDTDPGLAAPR